MQLTLLCSVEKCLKMCGLEHVADAVVGSLGVEHRKRTTIGVELVAKVQVSVFFGIIDAYSESTAFTDLFG